MENNERLFSVELTEEELKLFSEFLEQKEYAIARRFAPSVSVSDSRAANKWVGNAAGSPITLKKNQSYLKGKYALERHRQAEALVAKRKVINAGRNLKQGAERVVTSAADNAKKAVMKGIKLLPKLR